MLQQPSSFEEIKVNGKSRQKDPPTLRPGAPTGVSSQVSTSSSRPPPTIKACSSIFSIGEDQLSEFLGSDKVTFASLKENLLKTWGESLVHLG